MTNFQDMNKTELRAACKEAGIPYSKLTVGGMRDTLTAHYAASATEEVKEDIAPATESASVDLDTLQLTDDDNCPHCGIHLSNGIGDFEQLVELHGKKKAHELATREFQCMGCDGEWGALVGGYVSKPTTATGKGLKIEKDREERNGVKRPSVGGACRAVWDFLDGVVKNTGIQPTIGLVKEEAEAAGWNVNNASIEFYQWRKFHGIRGRQPKA